MRGSSMHKSYNVMITKHRDKGSGGSSACLRFYYAFARATSVEVSFCGRIGGLYFT